MLDNNFKVKLKMESDWQIGTGAGIPGSVDELVSKDVDGFPQIPAKTLVGIWRDALERLTVGLDNGNDKGEWSNWVEVIFGNQPNVEKNPTKTPVPAIISIQPARICEDLRAKLSNDKRLKQALTFVKVGVEIDSDSGTSKTEHLRFEEMGRIGTVLDADVECERMNETISALLILSAKLVERIGGKRRRGAGKCRLEIIGITTEEVKHAVETIRNKKTSADKLLAKGRDTFTQITADWQTCEYTLTLETPVSIVTAVLGNVSETLDFIPGTYLISHFVKHFGQNLFKEIQSNNFQILPATVCIDRNRSFPVPKVFAQEKRKKENVYNRLLETLDGKDQTKPIREGFYFEKDGKVFHVTTPQTILMHNAVDDEFQRPTTNVVGVYSREAIKAGTVLKGEIRFRNLQLDLTASSGKTKLDGKVRIGTSKKDDYGLAKLELGTPKAFQAKSGANSKRLIVYLASDVMLRNVNLRQTNSVEDLATELRKTLNTKLTEAKAENGLLSSILQVRRIESWQTSWGFPRPTLTLMQAGSVVVFDVQSTETEGADFESRLKEIEKNGIGERRGEGYGQIIFNLPILGAQRPAWEKWEKKDGTNANDSNGKTKLEDEVFPKLIEETAWREELKLAVSKIAADENLRRDIFGFEIKRNEKGEVTKTTPAMSQIGGLRSVVMRLQEFKDRSLVIDWLNHLKGTDNRIEKWDRGRDKRVAKQLVDNKLIPVFGTREKVWLVLCETEVDGVGVWHSPRTLVQAKEHLQETLWAEAVKSLFYACQHAHKRDSEKTGKGGQNNGAQN